MTLMAGGRVRAQAGDNRPDDAPPAPVVNDEGGAVSISGVLTYTNAFFTLGAAAPVIILEDQGGFIERNPGFLIPVASQTLGQITSDFYRSPFSYTISLPIEPQATLHDVDNDDAEDVGVMVFAPAYWTNIFGDPFLEERDLFGGGWSSAYASTRVSTLAETKREIVGGKLLVYAPDADQGFPADFGPDARLFTGDEATVRLPPGYTVVDLETRPFTFDRARHPHMDLLEPAAAAMIDFSAMSYVAAFDALVELLRREYAFSEHKGIDWDALAAAFRPRFAAAGDDNLLYRRALRDFSFAIPDGHINGPFVVQDFNRDTAGGLGMGIRDVDDGRVLVSYLVPGGPAAAAGIELGAEIIAFNGTPIGEHVDNTLAYSAPFSTAHYARLQRLRYAVRTQLGATVEIVYRNPGSSETATAQLTATGESESFSQSSFNAGLSGFELPVRYTLLPNGHALVRIFSFSDNRLLTVQLWERLLRTLKDENVPGLIIDLRQNGGGSNFLADQMAAYFFDESLELGNTGFYDEELDAFYFDPGTAERFYLPAEDLRYHGAVAVLIGPNCSSACEFFAYDMTLNGRAAIVGQYPTAGLGGSIKVVRMPEGQLFQYTNGRAVDVNGKIHIEGKGVAPTIRVPVDARTLFSDGDPVVDAAVAYLDALTAIDLIDGGPLTVGNVAGGRLVPGTRVRYSLAVSAGDVLDIYLEDATAQLDTVLRIYDMADNLLAFNDDAESRDTVNSAIEHFEIPVDLTLILEVGTYEDSNAGAYTLSVLPGEPLPLPEPTPVEVVAGTPPAEVQTPAADAPAESARSDAGESSRPPTRPHRRRRPSWTPRPRPRRRCAQRSLPAPKCPVLKRPILKRPTLKPPQSPIKSPGPRRFPLPTPTATPAPPRPTRATVRTQRRAPERAQRSGTDFARRLGRQRCDASHSRCQPGRAWILVAVEGLDEGDSGWIAVDYVELE
ncbi:MAG: S41 family peptidase [Caldilineaceae bacterium]